MAMSLSIIGTPVDDEMNKLNWNKAQHTVLKGLFFQMAILSIIYSKQIGNCG